MQCSVQVAYHGEQHARAAIRFDGIAGNAPVGGLWCVCEYATAIYCSKHPVSQQLNLGGESLELLGSEKGSITLNPRSVSELIRRYTVPVLAISG